MSTRTDARPAEPVVMALGRGWVRQVYEWTMIALAIVVAWMLTLPDSTVVWQANLAIWAVFVADYAARLWLSTDRRAFVRRNVPDLIAIIPLDLFRLARLARLARLVRMFRAGTALWRATRDLRGIAGTNGLSYVLAFALATVAAAATTIWAVEESITSFGDAVWWSLVTATTVGYGDIAPEAAIGRVMAVILMLVGIGTLGMITGSIATYFLDGSDDVDGIDPEVAHVRDRLNDWPELAPVERRRLAVVLTALADHSATGPR